MPRRRASAGPWTSSGAPFNRISPESGLCTPEISLIRVDLPAPLSPTSASTSPELSERSTPRRTLIGPKLLWRSATSSSGGTSSSLPRLPCPNQPAGACEVPDSAAYGPRQSVARRPANGRMNKVRLSAGRRLAFPTHLRLKRRQVLSLRLDQAVAIHPVNDICVVQGDAGYGRRGEGRQFDAALRQRLRRSRDQLMRHDHGENRRGAGDRPAPAFNRHDRVLDRR